MLPVSILIFLSSLLFLFLFLLFLSSSPFFRDCQPISIEIDPLLSIATTNNIESNLRRLLTKNHKSLEDRRVYVMSDWERERGREREGRVWRERERVENSFLFSIRKRETCVRSQCNWNIYFLTPTFFFFVRQVTWAFDSPASNADGDTRGGATWGGTWNGNAEGNASFRVTTAATVSLRRRAYTVIWSLFIR